VAYVFSTRRVGSQATQPTIVSPVQVTREVTRAGADEAPMSRGHVASTPAAIADAIPTHHATPIQVNPGYDGEKLLDNVPPRLQAQQFVEYFSDSLFDIDHAENAGASFASYGDMGVHRFWQCPRTKAVFAEILAPIVQEAYTEFCAHEWLVEHSWQTFARYLNQELQTKDGPRKPYTTVKSEETGKYLRLRCYRFSVPNEALGQTPARCRCGWQSIAVLYE